MGRARMNNNWEMVSDRIRSMWSDVEFTDKEMKGARGNLQDMVALIQSKTDEPETSIRRKVMTMV
jgi:hypothetical protein